MRFTVEKTLENYEKALACQSWKVVADYFHDDCVVVFAEATYYGKKQIGVAISKTFSMIKDEEFVLSNKRLVYESDEFATYVFNYKWAGTLNGKRFSAEGRGTIAFLKTNSQWQVISEHLGPMPL